MKNYLDQPVISLEKSSYLTLIIFLAPFLNFLAGITTDIFAPSLPAIARDLHTSNMLTKNTISITLFGWMIGAIVFGVLIDSLGRKITLILGILIYVLASLSVLWCDTIHALMVVRFIQGVSIASISIGCRLLILDTCSGRSYNMAILYTTVAYGLGPILGPFIGGILQHTFGWRANFMALFIVGTVMLSFLLIFIKESIPMRQQLIPQVIVKNMLSVLVHKKFLCGSVTAGIVTIQLLLYPTLGPFIVENLLHHSVLVYGNTALIVGACYLTGTLSTRFLLGLYSPKKICEIGLMVLGVGVILSFIFVFLSRLNLATVMIPIMLITVSAGLMTPNILGANLKQFPHTAGIAQAIQLGLIMLSTSIGLFIISHVHIKSLWQTSAIILVLAALEAGFFCYGYRSIFDEDVTL